MRIILYSGKGGVGKTSIAAATACHLAREGKKVLVMSTDQAHSLGDCLDVKLGPSPLPVADNLDAMEVDAVTECERVWGNLRDYIYRLMTSKNQETIESEELLVFPGFEELASLFKIKEIHDEGKYDVLIVDCAPTGETLSLLKFPEMFGRFVERIIPWKRKALNTVGQTVEKLTKIPMLSEKVLDDIELLTSKMDDLRELMWNKDVVSIRIVTTLEKIVMKETKRSFSYFHLYNYNVDAIIVNKVYPKEALDGYFHKWIVNQKEALEDLKDSFNEIPVFFLDLQKNELRTIVSLCEISKKLYGDTDPSGILFRRTIFSVMTVDGRDVFAISLPFFDLKDMELVQKGEEITLIINNERRQFTLPDKFRNKEIEKAKYEDGMLRLFF